MKRLLPLATLVLAAGCGATTTTTMVGSAEVPRATAFSCAQDQAKELGYDVYQKDDKDMRLVVRKENDEIQLADPTFHAAYDELTIESVAGASGGSELHVEARTLYEYFDRRGANFQQREPTTEVQLAAQNVLKKCTGGTGEQGQ